MLYYYRVAANTLCTVIAQRNNHGVALLLCPYPFGYEFLELRSLRSFGTGERQNTAQFGRSGILNYNMVLLYYLFVLLSRFYPKKDLFIALGVFFNICKASFNKILPSFFYITLYFFAVRFKRTRCLK